MSVTARLLGPVAAALLSAAAPSAAVVVANNDPMPPPAAGYVGSWNGSSAVAIGHNWIISAKHVGGAVGGHFTLRGQQYRAVEIRQHPTYDIQLIRVAESLPGYHQLSPAVQPGDIVVLGGCGATAGNAVANGYDWSGPRQETWGANIVESASTLVIYRFDSPDSPAAVPHEAIFAINDSGAGLFTVAPDNSLALAAIAVSVTGFGQSTWGNAAYSLNLDQLRSWIMPIVHPGEPVTSSVVAPRASLFSGGAPSTVFAAAVAVGLVFSRRRSAISAR